MSKFRKKKERMFKENPHCRRCGVLTWLTPKNDKRGTKGLTQEQFDTLATIGHKYSKLDDRRHTENARSKRYELICQKCNHGEASKEVEKIPLEEKWERSKAYPQSHPMKIANEQNKHDLSKYRSLK